MEDDFFDIAIEGTTINNCHAAEKGCRVIVIDRKNNYGSTYTSLEKLRESPYITMLDIKKTFQDKIVVESLPFVLRPNHPIVKAYSRKPFGAPLQFVDIRDVFFIDSNFKTVRLPICKTDIITMSQLNNTDRFHLYDSIKNKDIAIFKRHLIRSINESSIIYKIFIKYNIFNDDFIANFGNTSYVYPVYGMGEISENISLINSLNGYSYLLNKDIKISETGGKDDYRYKFECEFGVLYAKKFVRQDLREKAFYVRMLHVRNSMYNGNFMIYFEAEEVIRIIGLNSTCKVAPAGVQTIYFIKEHSPVVQGDIDGFMVTNPDIITDISFRTVYDIDQFG